MDTIWSSADLAWELGITRQHLNYLVRVGRVEEPDYRGLSNGYRYWRAEAAARIVSGFTKRGPGRPRKDKQ